MCLLILFMLKNHSEKRYLSRHIQYSQGRLGRLKRVVVMLNGK